MTGRLWGDRRAEAFQNALDGHVDLAERELVEFVQLAHALRDVPPATLGNEARSSIRAQLVAEADTVLQPSAPAPTRPRRRRAVRALAGSTAAVAALSAGLVTVSADALPGEVLYPIKRGVEQLELTFGGGTSAGSTHLDHASERLDEAASLAKTGGDSDQISSALRDFTSDTRTGTEQLLQAYASDKDRGAIEAIRTFASDAAARLHDLSPMLGKSTDAAFTQSVQAVESADRRAIEACPTCAGGPAVQVPYMVDPIGGVDALPRHDGHDDSGSDNADQDDFLADPQNLPKGTTLPHIDKLHQDHQQDSDDSGDTSRPKLHGANDSDGGSSSIDESGPDLGGGSGTDDGVIDLPDIPDTGNGIGGAIDLGPVEDILGPVQELLDRLGPLGDVLDPVLGDGSDSEKDDDSKGPLDGLLGPDTRKNRGHDRGTANPDKVDTHQDQTEQTTPGGDSGDEQNQNEQDNGPLDGLIGPVDETDDAPDVDEDGLGGLTGGDEGGTDGGSTTQ